MGKGLSIGVAEQGGGVLAGTEFFDSVATGDRSDVAGILFLAQKTGGRPRTDGSLLSFLKPSTSTPSSTFNQRAFPTG